MVQVHKRTNQNRSRSSTRHPHKARPSLHRKLKEVPTAIEDYLHATWMYECVDELRLGKLSRFDQITLSYNVRELLVLTCKALNGEDDDGTMRSLSEYLS